jgi:hypothetical protein
LANNGVICAIDDQIYLIHRVIYVINDTFYAIDGVIYAIVLVLYAIDVAQSNTVGTFFEINRAFCGNDVALRMIIEAFCFI